MQLKAFLQPIPDIRKVVSVLAELEVRSALERKLLLKEIDPSTYRIAIAELRQTLERYPVLAIPRPVIRLAADLIGRNRLRSLDSLQLASAVLAAKELEPSNDLLFIASDTRLLAAATAESLPCWNPAQVP